MTASCIYFIQAGDAGPIKVGFTSGDVQRRVTQLQTGNPSALAILGAIKGTAERERQLHGRLSPWRAKGEWFKPHPDVLQVIEDELRDGEQIVFELQSSVEDRNSSHPLKQWRGDRTQRIAAELLDTDPMTYSRWERGLFLPRRRSRTVIKERTGIHAEQLVAALKDDQ